MKSHERAVVLSIDKITYEKHALGLRAWKVGATLFPCGVHVERTRCWVKAGREAESYNPFEE